MSDFVVGPEFFRSLILSLARLCNNLPFLVLAWFWRLPFLCQNDHLSVTADSEKHDASKPGSFPSVQSQKLLQMPGTSAPLNLLQRVSLACSLESESESAALFDQSSLLPSVGGVARGTCNAHWTVCLICVNARELRDLPLARHVLCRIISSDITNHSLMNTHALVKTGSWD